MKNFNIHTSAGDMRIAGTNYENVPARATFAELADIAEEYADYRMFGCESGEAKVTFEKMSQVGGHAAVTRLADNIVR